MSNYESVDCTENMCVPKCQKSSFIQSIYSIRYSFIKYLCCPVNCIPFWIPIFGGRTYFELIIYTALCIGCIIYAVNDLKNGGGGRKLIVTSILTFERFLKNGNGNGSEGEDEDEGGIGSGQEASALGAIALFLGLRGLNIITFLFGISFERSVHLHKMIAVLAIAVSLIHGLVFESFLDSDREISGTILFIAMIVTSCTYLLKKFFFEIFYYLHIAIYLFIIVVSFLHGAVFFGISGIVWLLDLLFRYYIQNHTIQAQFEILPADVTKIKFRKPESFQYNALQYIFISVPEISAFEYHPFTLSSAPHEDMVSIHTRALGNWTRKLRRHGVYKKGINEPNLNICVEGPFGLPSVNFKSPEYQIFMLITGGIGITPAQSLFKDILHRHAKKGQPLRKIIFLWSVRETNMLNQADDVYASPHPNGTQSFIKDSEMSTNLYNDLPTSFQPNLIFPFNSEDKSDIESIKNNNSSLKKITAKSDDNTSPNRSTIASANPVHIEFFLTQMKNNSDLDNMDPSTRPYITPGRPNLSSQFQQVIDLCAKEGMDQSRVAVMTCGPQPMVKEVFELCLKHNRCCGGVKFDLHMEEFDF